MFASSRIVANRKIQDVHVMTARVHIGHVDHHLGNSIPPGFSTFLSLRSVLASRSEAANFDSLTTARAVCSSGKFTEELLREFMDSFPSPAPGS